LFAGLADRAAFMTGEVFLSYTHKKRCITKEILKDLLTFPSGEAGNIIGGEII
jgi:hypothetical protein